MQNSQSLVANKSIYSDKKLSQIIGGAGNDTLISSYQTQWASELSYKPMVGYNGLGEEVRYTLSYLEHTLVGGGNLLDGGAGNDFIKSERPDKTLSNGINTLSGGEGNDTLIGSYGDILTGGVGVDTFKLCEFARTTDQALTVTDFKTGTLGDKLDFSDYREGLGSVGVLIDNVFDSSVFRAYQNGNSVEIQINNEKWFGNPDADPTNDKWTTALKLENVSAKNFTRENFVNLGDQFLKFYIDGSDIAETIQGGGFNDEIRAGGGNDIVNAGDGNDVIWAGSGNDLVNGGVGNDALNGGIGNDALFGETGNDVLDAGDGNDMMDGGLGNDNVIGGLGNDVILGGAGNDTLTGAGSLKNGVGEIDQMTGGVGVDIFNLGFSKSGFYDDGNASSFGRSDYALITDFAVGQDKLQLKGAASGYYLAASGVAGVSGIGLYAEQGATDELVAIIRTANASALNWNNTVKTAVFI